MASLAATYTASLLLKHNVPIYAISDTLDIVAIETKEQLSTSKISSIFDSKDVAIQSLIDSVLCNYEQARQIVNAYDKLKAQYPHHFL